MFPRLWRSIEGEVDPDLKISSKYVVQLPSPECTEEIIRTPPLAPEANLRFSQRNAQIQQENMLTRAANLAEKKDNEGINLAVHKNSCCIV